MNQSANAEQKAELTAIANSDDPELHRVTKGLAGLAAGIENALGPDQRPLVARIVENASNFPPAYGTVARALLGFNGTVSAEDKAALLNL